MVLTGNMSWLRECLDNKVGINGLDKAGNTALYWASHGGHKGNGYCLAINVRRTAFIFLNLLTQWPVCFDEKWSWPSRKPACRSVAHLTSSSIEPLIFWIHPVPGLNVSDVVELLLGQPGVEVNQQVRSVNQAVKLSHIKSVSFIAFNLVMIAGSYFYSVFTNLHNVYLLIFFWNFLT